MPATSAQKRLSQDAEYLSLVTHFSQIKLSQFLRTGWQEVGGDVAVESVLNRGGTLPPVPRDS
jgi:hypothetical protein